MSFTFRFGEADDIPVIRDFVMDAGAGLFEYLLDDAIPGLSARYLLKLAVADPNSNLSYQNALVAEDVAGKLAGAALCYPAADFGIPMIVRSIVPKSRLAPLETMLRTRIEDTLYLNTLAVADHARGQALGRTLLDLAMEWARQRDLDGMSLHVWEGNQAALELYRQGGFRQVERFALPAADQFREGGAMLLMQAPLDPDAARASDPGG